MTLSQLNPLRALLIPVNWCRWLWFQPPHAKDMQEIQVYIALTFGIGPAGTPGLTNEQIARQLGELWVVAPRPIIAQKEVYDALQILGKIPMENVYHIPGPNEDRKNHLHHHSADSVQDTLVISRQYGWSRIALVGQINHMPRVMWCFQKERIEVMHVQTSNIGYCPNSIQSWCRGSVVFIAWELLLAIPAYTLTNKI